MTVADRLLQRVEQLLLSPHAKAALAFAKCPAPKAYEGYIMALCAVAMRRTPGAVVKTKGNTSPVPPFFLRGAPGSIASCRHNYCFVSCDLPGRSLEIHQACLVTGHSGTEHELDVGLIRGPAARRCRDGGPLPECGDVLLLYECKCLATPVGVGAARHLVGLLTDLYQTASDLPRPAGLASLGPATAAAQRYLEHFAPDGLFQNLRPRCFCEEERFVGHAKGHALVVR